VTKLFTYEDIRDNNNEDEMSDESCNACKSQPSKSET